MELYVAKKSAWGAVSFLWILSCILIIPIFIIIVRIFMMKAEKITFYEDKIVYESGLLNKRKKTFAFTGVYRVDIEQSIIGRMCNYGRLDVDFVGRTDLNTSYIKDPNSLAQFLETKIVKKENVQTHMF